MKGRQDPDCQIENGEEFFEFLSIFASVQEFGLRTRPDVKFISKHGTISTLLILSEYLCLDVYVKNFLSIQSSRSLFPVN